MQKRQYGKKEKKSFFKWIKENKELLITLGVITVSTGIAIITIKNWNTIKQLFNKKVTSIDEGEKVIEEVVETTMNTVKKVPDNVDLSGEKYTATQLEKFMGVSAQEVNKRLVKEGLQEKSYNNEYNITSFGDYFGDSTWKETKSGHSFVNNVWCKGTLNIIFTSEEIAEHKRRMEYARMSMPKKDV